MDTDKNIDKNLKDSLTVEQIQSDINTLIPLDTLAQRRVHEARIKEIDFLEQGIAPLWQVKKSLLYVERRLREFKAQRERKSTDRNYFRKDAMCQVENSLSDESTDLEYIVATFLAGKDWFDDENGNKTAPDDASMVSCETRMASLTDDIGHGTDIILFLNNQIVGRKALSLDTTLIDNVGQLAGRGGKFDGSRADKSLPRGWTHLDYAQDGNATDIEGQVKYVPRFIIGAELEDSKGESLLGLLNTKSTKLTEQQLKYREKWEVATALKVTLEILKQAKCISKYLNENQAPSQYTDNMVGVVEYFTQARKKVAEKYKELGGDERDLYEDRHFRAIIDASETLLKPRDDWDKVSFSRVALKDSGIKKPRTPVTKIYDGALLIPPADTPKLDDLKQKAKDDDEAA